MSPTPFILVTPATRGLSLALARYFLRSTHYPIYATHRSGPSQVVKEHILKATPEVDPNRLHLLKLDLTSEDSIASAANALANSLQKNFCNFYMHTAVFTGGVLYPEKKPSDLDLNRIQSMFQINTISHLLLIKHFFHFLPTSNITAQGTQPSKWVHVSARLGSISDNKHGGWFSYRSSKAALNQIIKTFDLYLQMNGNHAMCVGIHPGTVKTDLSQDFWESVGKNKLFEPLEAAKNVARVIEQVRLDQRGRVWDWAGTEVPW
ncbi:hypothetical protein AMATHDRAFT_139803 [Amanita thiersii Skay4041]|uniref:NAD(P)-binding protein n=1 Tax=Amanita thiersii Skay4041 TaxID=703135 RepID=A0A2A9NNV1_9AGAR|nr:hypothetical protein AMATHDRAFT_139803 [Amanita thiersii Skay4041]